MNDMTPNNDTNMKYSAADIEALKQEDPANLSPMERKLANLKPIQKGEVRNPKGRGKGVKNWSTHFKKLMGDEKLLKSVISAKPSEWEGIVDDIPADVIAAGLIATVTREVSKSVVEGKPIDKDTLKAIELLNKTAFGEKQILDTEEGFFSNPTISFTVVPDRKARGDEESY